MTSVRRMFFGSRTALLHILEYAAKEAGFPRRLCGVRVPRRVGCFEQRKPALSAGLFFACLLLYTMHAYGQSQSGQSDYESHLEEAVRAQSAGDIKAAISAYQGALRIQRDVPEVWGNLGLMQHQAGDYAGAVASFTTAHQLQPKLFVPILFLGLDNLELGNKSDAIRYLLIAGKLHPDDPNIDMYLGRAYFGLKEFDAAAVAYAHATLLNQKSGEAWYRLGVTYLEIAEVDSGRLAKLHRQSPFFQALEAESLGSQDRLIPAEKAYRKLLPGQNLPPCTRSSLGLILVGQGKLPEAEAEFLQDVHTGGCLLAEMGLTRLALEKGDAEAAATSLSSLWKLDTGFVKANISLLVNGLARERFVALDDALAQSTLRGLTAEEVDSLRASLRGEPAASSQADGNERRTGGKAEGLPAALAFYKRGEYRRCVNSLVPAKSTLSHQGLSLWAACSFFTGDPDSTIDAARKLQEAPPSEDEALYWLIRANQFLAVGCLVRAGEVEPDSIRIHELLAESYRDMGKFGAAEAEYSVALGINPRDFAALIGAAANYLQEYRIEPASEMIGKALEQNPADPEANYIAGEVLIDQHKYGDAEPHLIAALSAKAELLPRIHALLGRIYASRGDNARAIEQFTIGISSDDDGSLHFQLGRLYQKTGEPKLAHAAFDESRRLGNRHIESDTESDTKYVAPGQP